MLKNMLPAGATTFHRQTVERQREQHDEENPSRHLGEALDLSARRTEKMRAGSSYRSKESNAPKTTVVFLPSPPFAIACARDRMR